MKLRTFGTFRVVPRLFPPQIAAASLKLVVTDSNNPKGEKVSAANCGGLIEACLQTLQPAILPEFPPQIAAASLKRHQFRCPELFRIRFRRKLRRPH